MKEIDQYAGETFPDEELENRYQRYREIIKNFTLMSDTFMRNVFKHIECVEYVLQVIMGKKDLRVVDSVVQKDYKNLQGRSAILDCVARDVEDKRYDVEVQQKNEGASPKRSRYHSGLVDMNTLEAGHDFDELPDSYVIFITRGDVLGLGLPVGHIDRKIEEVDQAFEDGSHIVYVNAAMQNEKTELVNITVRRSRQSGVARATCPDQRSHLLIVTQPEQDLDHIPLSWKGLLMDRCSRC